MVLPRLLVAVALTLLGVSAPAAEPTIEYDEKDNPKSPQAGQVLITGTYSLPSGSKFDKIEVDYRKAGERTWTLNEKQLEYGERDGAKTWKLLLKDLPAGRYELRVRLRFQDAAGANIVRNVERNGKEVVKTIDVRGGS